MSGDSYIIVRICVLCLNVSVFPENITTRMDMNNTHIVQKKREYTLQNPTILQEMVWSMSKTPLTLCNSFQPKLVSGEILCFPFGEMTKLHVSVLYEH